MGEDDKILQTSIPSPIEGTNHQEGVVTTLLLEAEGILISGSITFASSDEDDLEALTPMHFLIGSTNTDYTPNSLITTEMFEKKQ